MLENGDTELRTINRQGVRAYQDQEWYQLDSASFTVCLPLQVWLNEGTCSLECGAQAWDDACREEDLRGSSKIACTCDSGRLVVGLIAGRVCKLLDCQQIRPQDAIGAIARRFHPKREALLVPSLPDVPPTLRVSAVEKLLHLWKQA